MRDWSHDLLLYLTNHSLAKPANADQKMDEQVYHLAQ